MFFRRAAPTSSSELFLYADTRYRLFVDGQILSTGPARSVPADAMFDRIEIPATTARDARWLVVEVLCVRANNFQAMPGTPGAFAAWGYDGEDDLSSGWEVCLDNSWQFPTPHYSFAQGPVEVCDTRDLPHDRFAGGGGGWVRPATVDDPVYSGFKPSDLPPVSMLLSGFARAFDLGLSRSEEARVVGCRYDFTRAVDDPRNRPRFAWAMFVHSPTAMDVDAGIFWGPNYLNGIAIVQRDDGLRCNRQSAVLNLREGWNLLYGEPEFFAPVWGVMVAFPRSAGLTVRGDPDFNSANVMRLSHLMPPDTLKSIVGPRPIKDAKALDACGIEWDFVSSNAPIAIPARDMAWDLFGSGGAGEVDPSQPLSRTLCAGEVWSVVFDMDSVYLGFAHVDVSAPTGTVMDLAYEERRRADGAVDLFSSNPFCETAERWFLDGTRRVIEPSQPRGGRYLQITLRAVAHGDVTLHAVRHRDVKRPVVNVGTLTSSDPLLDWTYDVSRRSIEATLEDGYVDPWRERGLYLGDAYVAGLAHLCVSPDARHAAHSIRLFADGRRDDGLPPGCVPAHLRHVHEDYALLWINWLRLHWQQTGDHLLLVELFPAVRSVLASPHWQASSVSGLWDCHAGRLFLDWGVHHSARNTRENACLNAIRYRVLCDAATLADAAGSPVDAREWLGEAQAVREAFNDRLWLSCEHGFALGSDVNGNLLDKFNAPANLLALWARIARGDRLEALLRLTDRQLQQNPTHARTGPLGSGYFELYFLRFASEAFAENERTDLSLRTIRDHFALLRDANMITLPEEICRGLENRDSLCHCWGAWPIEFVARRLAGVSLQLDGSVRVVPSPADVERLDLTVPVGTGSVRVQWDQACGRAYVTLSGLTRGIYIRPDTRTPLYAGLNTVQL